MVKNGGSEQQCSWHAVPGSGHGCEASGWVGASGQQEGWMAWPVMFPPQKEAGEIWLLTMIPGKAATSQETGADQSQGRAEALGGMFSWSEISGKDISLDHTKATGKRSRIWCQGTNRPQGSSRDAREAFRRGRNSGEELNQLDSAKACKSMTLLCFWVVSL